MNKYFILQLPVFREAKSFHKVMKFLVISTGMVIPILVGYWRYGMTSEPNPLKDAIGWAILGIPFSIGLWLSVSPFVIKIRYFTLLLILLGAPIHIMFSEYLHVLYTPVVILIEIYAIYLLFGEGR